MKDEHQYDTKISKSYTTCKIASEGEAILMGGGVGREIDDGGRRRRMGGGRGSGRGCMMSVSGESSLRFDKP